VFAAGAAVSEVCWPLLPPQLIIAAASVIAAAKYHKDLLITYMTSSYQK